MTLQGTPRFDKWRIECHTSKVMSGRVVRRWWLVRPKSHPRPWIAEHVGTFDECREAFKQVMRQLPQVKVIGSGGGGGGGAAFGSGESR